MPSDTQNTFSQDFLLSSGNQVESYLTYAARQIPVSVSSTDRQGTKVYKIDKFILINNDGTQVYDYEINPIPSQFQNQHDTL